MESARFQIVSRWGKTVMKAVVSVMLYTKYLKEKENR